MTWVSFIQFVVVPILVVSISTWGVIRSRKAQKGSRENDLIDQLQEQIRERDDFWVGQINEVKETAAKAETDAKEARKEAASVKLINLSLFEYAHQLRQDVINRAEPPPREWPELIRTQYWT